MGFRPSHLVAIALTSVFFRLNCPPGLTQIVPDTTLPETSRVTPGCTNCLIDGGTTHGVNLFHSFKDFSIPTNGTAWFNNAPTIQTILTRVTGNSISSIDGLMKTNGKASLFFLNPNGILFGPNARLEIGGSFLASTTSSFKFSDGSEFSGTNPQAPPILAINLTPGLQYGAPQPGSILANQGTLVAGQDLILSADRLDLQGQLHAGRDLTLHATDVVRVRDTSTLPFQAHSQGNLTVQGDRGIDILALNHLSQTPFLSIGNLALISEGVISADAWFASGGTFQVKTLSGQVATLTSLHDPIISSSGDIDIAGDYRGAALLVESLGSVRFGGSVEINQPDFTFSPTDPDPDLAALGSSRAFIVRAGRDSLLYAPSTLPQTIGEATFQNSTVPLGITIVGGVFTGGGPIILDAGRGNITTQDLATISLRGGDVTLLARNGDISAANIVSLAFAGAGGNVHFETQNGDIRVSGELNTFSVGGVPADGGFAKLITHNGNIFSAPKINTFSFSGGNAGKIDILAGDRSNSPSLGNIILGEVNAFSSTGNGGAITIFTPHGDITATRRVLSYSDNRDGGTISIRTGNGDITFPLEIDIQSRSWGGKGGRIEVISDNGNVSLDRIFAFGNDDAGKVDIMAPNGKVSFYLLLAHSFGGNGNGGDVSLVAGKQGLESQAIATFSRQNQGGNLSLLSLGDIELTAINTTGKTGSGSIVANSGGSFDMALDLQTTERRLGSPIVSSDTFGSGRGGDIEITAQTVRLANGAQLTASTHSNGQGGNITVRATNLVQIEGILPEGFSPNTEVPGGFAGVEAGTYLGGYIASGNVNNIGQEQTLFPSGIYSQTTTDSTGNAGNILVETPQLVIQNRGAIASTTFGQGTGGLVQIRTNNGFTSINDGSILSGVGIGGIGNSGSIDIQTRHLTLTNGGLIQSQTLGAGNAGIVQINATDSVRLNGLNTAIRSGSGDLQTQGTQIGEGGNLQMTTPLLEIVNNATLSAETFTAARGGSITINGVQLEASQGGQLRTTTFNQGQAGNINLFLSNHLTLSDSGTGLFADTAIGSTGAGGSIFIDPEQVLVRNNAVIAVDSRGAGQGGSIFVQAGQLTLSDRGSITAETASAQGGNIVLDVRDLLLLRRNSLISATAGTAQGSGNGGNITITAPFIVSVLAENNDIRANAFTGQGGNVTLNAIGIYGLQLQNQLTPLSDITASSQFGISGVVTINTLNIDPNRGLVVLPGNFADASNQISQEGCVPQSATAQTVSNRFVMTGRGGLPDQPDNMQGDRNSVVELIDLVNVQSQQQEPSHKVAPTSSKPYQTQPNEHITEAQGWAIAPNGTVQLIAHSPEVTPLPSWQPATSCSKP